MPPTAPRSSASPASTLRPTTPRPPRPRWPRSAPPAASAPPGLPELAFDPATDLAFDYGPPLPGHANGMILQRHRRPGRHHPARDLLFHRRRLRADRGRAGRRHAEPAPAPTPAAAPTSPFPFETAAEMLAMAAKLGPDHRPDEARERTASTARAEDLDRGIARLWQVMNACIDRGLAAEGTLPGGLNVRRRAEARCTRRCWPSAAPTSPRPT